MYNIDKVVMRNVNTHVNTTITFPKSGAVMISGINLDKDSRSNGSGKSTVAEAIAVALTGESFRHQEKGSSAKDLVRNGEKFLDVSIHLSNGVDLVVIDRTINAGTKPSSLNITVNGETPSELPTSTSGNGVDIKAGNDYIQKFLLGISRDDLFNYYLLSKDTFQSFLRSTDGDKKKVINRFSNIESIDPAFHLIKDDIKRFESQILEKEKSIISLTSKIESEEEHLRVYQESLKNDIKQANIDALNVRIRDERDKITSYEVQLSEAMSKLSAVQMTDVDFSDIIAKCSDEIKSLKDKIKIITDSIEKEQVKISSLNAELRELREIQAQNQSMVNGAVECPKCHHKFSLSDSEFDIDEAKDILVEIRKAIEETEVDIKNVNAKVAVSNAERTSLISLNSLTERVSYNIKFSTDNLNLLLKSLEEETNKVYTVNDKSHVYLEKISSFRESIELIEAEIEDLRLKIQDCNVQDGNFKKFKNHLANQSLSIIEGNTNKYLQMCKSDLTISLDGYKELKSGEFREQITCCIYRNGIVEGSFNKLSGGEKAVVTCCNILALQSIINSTCKGGGLNFSFFDEINDSVDATGMTELYDSLNGLKNVTLLVSHVRDAGFENHIFIQKSGGISTVVDKEIFVKNSSF